MIPFQSPKLIPLSRVPSNGLLNLGYFHSISHAECCSCSVKPAVLDGCLCFLHGDCIALCVLSLHNTPWARASCCGSGSSLQGIPDRYFIALSEASHSQRQCRLHHGIWGIASVSYLCRCIFVLNNQYLAEFKKIWLISHSEIIILLGRNIHLSAVYGGSFYLTTLLLRNNPLLIWQPGCLSWISGAVRL